MRLHGSMASSLTGYGRAIPEGVGTGNHVTKSKRKQTHVIFRMIVSLSSTSYVALN